MTCTPRSSGPFLVAAAAALALAACGDAERSVDEAAASEGASGAEELVRRPGQPLDSATASALSRVRAATARYERPEAAMEDGYVLFTADPDGRTVGYVDGAAVADDGTSALDQSLDPARPEILIYARDAGGEGAGPGWRLAAVEYAVPKTEAGSTRPEAAMELFPGLRPGDWREHPTREELGMNVKWTGYGDCHYEGGAEVTLAGGPGHTYLQLPPGAVTGDSWDGPPVGLEACNPTFEGQELVMVHGKLWMLRAWIGVPNPEGVFRATNPRVEG